MKKTLHALIAAVAAIPFLFSCTEKEQDISVENGAYEYRFEIADIDTRATLEEHGVFWDAGKDVVSLFLVNGNTTSVVKAAEVKEVEGAKVVVFSTDEPLQAGTMIYAYYTPETVESMGSVDEANLVFPGNQEGGAKSAMPMAGVPFQLQDGDNGNNGVIRFLNLGSIIAFRVFSENAEYQAETIQSVQFAAKSGGFIAGNATVNLADATIANKDNLAATVVNGSQVVTLTETATVAASKEEAAFLYMVVAPGTYTGTFVVNTDAASYTYSVTDKTFIRNGLKKFSLNLDNATRKVPTVYSLVTKEEDVIEGNYLIVAADDDKVFDGSGTYHGGYAAISATEDITRDAETDRITISGETASYDFAFAKSGKGFTITGAKGMIVAAANSGASTSQETYITFAATGGSVFLQRGTLTPNNGKTALLFSTTRGTSSEEYIYFNTNNNIFKIGGSGATTGIHLYYAGIREPQTLYFEETGDKTYDLYVGGSFDEPSLNIDGVKTSVSYSSSDPNIATVDENGEVTFNTSKLTGDVVITATAVANSEYLSASASYTIHVENSDPKKRYYVKINSLDEIVDGTAFLIVREDDSKAFKPVLNGSVFVSGDAQNAVGVTIESSKIESTGAVAACQVILEKDSGSKYFIKVPQADRYLVPTRSGSWTYTYTFAAQSSAASTTFAYTNSAFNIGSSSTGYIAYTNGYFSAQNSSSSLALYMLEDGRDEQSLSFSHHAAEYDLYSKSWKVAVPELDADGVKTSVEYDSSDPNIVSVNTTTGAVQVLDAAKAGDSVTITATAIEDEDYKKAEDSYVITIVNNDPSLPKYTKVTSNADLEVGAKYLLVYEATPSVFKPILASGGTYFTKGADNVVSTTITDNTITSGNYGAYEITLETGYYLYIESAQKYLYPGASGNSALGAEDKTEGHTVSISISTDGIATIARSNDATYHIYWSINSNYFSAVNQTGSSYPNNLCLYKLVDNRSPQVVKFEYKAAEYDLYTDNWTIGVPSLDQEECAIQTSLEYESSAPEKVSVVKSGDNAGTVTVYKEKVQKGDVITITATAVEDTDYKPASDSYTITITAPEEQTLVFAQPSPVTFNLAGQTSATFTNAVSGNHTEVTYEVISCEPEGKVTISDASTGELTITGTATAIIRASASYGVVNDVRYAPATAEYTLTVEDRKIPVYVKADEVEAGVQYLIVSNGYALKNNNSSTAGAETVQVTGDEIHYDAPASVLWTAAESSGKFTFKNDTRYLVRSSSNIQLNTSNPTSWAYDAANEYLTASGSNSTYYFYYSTSNSKFSASSSQSDTHVAALYYKLGDGEKRAQKLSFSEEEVKYNMSVSMEFVEPKLNGAKTTVSYASDETSVATVDESTGEVTIQGEGEATITATAIETDKYSSGAASYTITVINKTEYYVKVNSRDELPGSSQTSATGDYIFVYEDGAKAHVFKAICNGTPTGAGNTNDGHVELEKTGSAIEVDLTSNGIEATADVRACKLQLAHHDTATRNDWNLKPVSLGTYWIRVYNNGTNVRILAMTSAGYSATYTFEGDGNNLEIKRTDSNRNAYWSYNATNDCFEGTATASKISIYKLSE